jgi:hypothetical protein
LALARGLLGTVACCTASKPWAVGFGNRAYCCRKFCYKMGVVRGNWVHNASRGEGETIHAPTHVQDWE